VHAADDRAERGDLAAAEVGGLKVPVVVLLLSQRRTPVGPCGSRRGRSRL